MPKPTPNITDEIKRYLRSGDPDMDARAWLGDFMERGHHRDADLRAALIEEVRRLATGHTHELVPANAGIELTRAKVEPMVRGFFARAKQDIVLATLEVRPNAALGPSRSLNETALRNRCAQQICRRSIAQNPSAVARSLTRMPRSAP